MSASLIVNGEPWQYETEANAGVVLSSGEKWWGTLVKYRRGLTGRWTRATLMDVHPFDTERVECGVRLLIEARHP